MTEQIDCIVIGAGVVGLAVARALAQTGLETIVLESQDAIGTGTSSRNSEVVHAGIYYPQGSLKARLCVRGRDALYSYCDQHGIAFKRCGKLIVATSNDQIPALQAIAAAAAANGVDDLVWLTSDQAQAKEPALNCVAALESPSTGIVDSHSLMVTLQGELEAAGGMVAFCSPLVAGQVLAGGAEGTLLHVGGDEAMTIQARYVVNCAGLHALDIAHRLDGLPSESIPRGRLAKGNYYSLTGATPFSRLIYPVPQNGGLGVHLTLDLNGRARFGPDVEWTDTLDYTVNPRRADAFYSAIRRYWPQLPDDVLCPDYAGIRPKLWTESGADADFMIQDATEHGIKGLVNLYGIESPGLTAALAIADEVVRRLVPPTQ